MYRRFKGSNKFNLEVNLLKSLLFIIICLGSLSIQNLANAATFSVGSHVQANTGLNVRSTPGGSLLTTVPSGTLGTVLAGPQGAIYSGTYYNWYQVDWDGIYATGWSVEGGLTAVTAPSGFGNDLGSFNGVTAYSNGSTTYVSYTNNYIGGTYIGMKWQCVEYARRYYYSIYSMDLAASHLGDANTWYSNASTMGLESYPNGSSTIPQVGDILTSGYSYGHLAIVKSVTSNQVSVIQQNWSNSVADANKILTLSLSNGNYTIGGFSANYTVQGWLRKPGTTSCTYSLSPTSVANVAYSGSSGSFSVNTQSGCARTTVSNASWITITSGGSGTGTGSVSYTVAANSSTSPRTGTVSVYGASTYTFTMTQNGAPATCTYSLSPTSVTNVAYSGSSGSFNVNTQSNCSRITVSNDSWITITSGGSGTGTGSVSYTVAANSSTSPRTGTVSVYGASTYTFTVTQNGAPTACTYSLSPTSVTNVAYSSSSGSFNVNTQSGCARMTFSNDSWITITSGGSGTGTGSVSYTVAANSSTSPRTGTVSVYGAFTYTFTVTQNGAPAPCTYSLSPTSVTNVAYSGSSGSFSVNTQSGCARTTVSNASWITITSGGSGTGTGSVSYTVAANSSTSPRTGTVSVYGASTYTFTVTQNGAPAPLTPDLVVQDPSSSDTTLMTGETFLFSVTVKNQGIGASSSTMLRYYKSTDPTISISDIQLVTDTVESLLPGALVLRSKGFIVSTSTPAGSFWIGACVDTVTDETALSNNCSVGVELTIQADSDGDDINDGLPWLMILLDGV